MSARQRTVGISWLAALAAAATVSTAAIPPAASGTAQDPAPATMTGATTDGAGDLGQASGGGSAKTHLKVAIVYLEVRSCNATDPHDGTIFHYPDQVDVWLDDPANKLKQIAWVVQPPGSTMAGHAYDWSVDPKPSSPDPDAVPPADKKLSIKASENGDQWVFVSDVPKPKGPGSTETWSYEVTVLQDGKPCAVVDPDVIIHH